MTPERYQKIGEHYRAVQELEPGEREAYLEQACAGDDEMRREVESLLGFQSKAESFIEENALVVEARQLEAEDLSTIKAQAGAGRQIGGGVSKDSRPSWLCAALTVVSARASGAGSRGGAHGRCGEESEGLG